MGRGGESVAKPSISSTCKRSGASKLAHECTMCDNWSGCSHADAVCALLLMGYKALFVFSLLSLHHRRPPGRNITKPTRRPFVCLWEQRVSAYLKNNGRPSMCGGKKTVENPSCGHTMSVPKNPLTAYHGRNLSVLGCMYLLESLLFSRFHLVQSLTLALSFFPPYIKGFRTLKCQNGKTKRTCLCEQVWLCRKNIQDLESDVSGERRRTDVRKIESRSAHVQFKKPTRNRPQRDFCWYLSYNALQSQVVDPIQPYQ
jgi:hypothetical protein